MDPSPQQIALVRLQARLTKRFHKACADYGLIKDGDNILIGLSGGKDSLALVELLGKRAQIHVPRFQVTAVHVRAKERNYQNMQNPSKTPSLTALFLTSMQPQRII